MQLQMPVPLLLGMAYGLSEVALGIRKRSRDDSVDADDSSLRVLWITIMLAMSAAIFVSYRVPTAAIGGPVAPWAGGILFALGLVLRWYSIVYLGRFFTVNVAIHSQHEIIDTGPYRLIRHPSYTGALLAFLGLSLCMANWLSLAIVMLPTLWAFLRRIGTEESALASALGAPYTRYMGRTKRLAPFIY